MSKSDTIHLRRAEDDSSAACGEPLLTPEDEPLGPFFANLWGRMVHVVNCPGCLEVLHDQE